MLPTTHFKGSPLTKSDFLQVQEFLISISTMVNRRVKYSLPGTLMEMLRKSEPGPKADFRGIL